MKLSETSANRDKISASSQPHQNEGGVLARLELRGIGPAKKLELDFSERVNLLTGDNGLGKSFVLDCAWWTLSGQWASFPAYPREDAKKNEPRIDFEILSSNGKKAKGKSIYDWDLQQWPVSQERPTIPGLLIYARVDGAFAVWDPARDYWAASQQKSTSRPLIFAREDIWDGLRDNASGKTTFLSNGLISDWINWQNSPNEQPFATLKKVLGRLSPPGLTYGDLGSLAPGSPTRIPRDSRWIPTIQHAYGQIPLLYASAGVKRIVALAYLIVWAWEEHKTQSQIIRKEPQNRMIILMDEIEAHLHPQWQRTILPALLDVQKELSAELCMQLMIATHSPLVMSSIEPFFDAAKDKIFHIDLARSEQLGAEVQVETPDFVKYGTVDSWLRSEIFGLAQARHLEAERAIEDAKRLQNQENVTKPEVAEVSQRLLKYLPAHDSFWPRWLFFAEQYGVVL